MGRPAAAIKAALRRVPQMSHIELTDEEIRDEIRNGVDRWGEVWDPHTATAAAVRGRVSSALGRNDVMLT